MEVANESREGSANFHRGKNLKEKVIHLILDRHWESNPSTPVLKRLGPGRVGPHTIPDFLNVYGPSRMTY